MSLLAQTVIKHIQLFENHYQTLKFIRTDTQYPRNDKRCKIIINITKIIIIKKHKLFIAHCGKC